MTIVNIALPAIDKDLDAGTAGLTWTVNAYTLTLSALILLGGSLGDRLGRRRVFLVGVTWFAVASLLCGIAPTVELLVAARGLQGIGGALLTPGSLAILQASFRPEDRSRAIGIWSGFGATAAVIGPLVGGWLLDVGSWRWVFLVNLPVAGLVLLLARHIPETKDADAPQRSDVVGVVWAVIGLGGLTYGLTTGSLPTTLIGAVCLIAFVVHEGRTATTDDAARRLPVALLQRDELRHLPRVRRTRWNDPVAGGRAPGGRGRVTDASRLRAAPADRVHAAAFATGGRRVRAHRPDHADDDRPIDHGGERRRPHPGRRRDLLPDRRDRADRRLRDRPRHHGHAPDRDRIGGRSRPPCRDRKWREQRGSPHRQPARDRGASSRHGHRPGRLRRRSDAAAGLRQRDVDLRRTSGRRRAALGRAGPAAPTAVPSRRSSSLADRRSRPRRRGC